MSEEQSSNKKTWIKITCLGCVVLPCLCGLLTIGYIKYKINQQGAQLPVEVAKLRKMGVPTEPDDLKPNPPIPEGENAAPIYKEIGRKIEGLAALKEPPQINQAMAAHLTWEEFLDDHKLATEGIAHRAEIFKLAEKAAQRPKCDFGRDYSKGAYMLFPEYSQMKTLSKWLCLRAKFQAQAGDFDGALRSLHASFAIASHVGSEPNLIGALVAFAVDSITMAGLEQVTIIGRNNPDFLAKSRKMLESLPPLPDMRHAYGGELVMGRFTVRTLKSLRDLQMAVGADPSTEGNEPPSPSPLDRMAMSDDVRKMIEAKYVGTWRWVFERLPKDPDDWQGQEAVMNQLDTMLQQDNSLENKVNQILFPIFSQASVARGASLARRRVALVATRLLQDRSAGLPADLSRYGKLAIDPMNDKPMGYERKGKGFKVWSIDRDQKDNGGSKRIPGMKVTSGDFDFVWGFDFGFPVPPKPTKYRIPPPGSTPFGGPGMAPRSGPPGSPMMD